MSARAPAAAAIAPRSDAWRELFDGGLVAHVLQLVDNELEALRAGAVPELPAMLRRELVSRLDDYLQLPVGADAAAAAGSLYRETFALAAALEAEACRADAAPLRAQAAAFRAAWQEFRAEGASHEVYSGQPMREKQEVRRRAVDAARKAEDETRRLKDEAQRLQRKQAGAVRGQFVSRATGEELTEQVLATRCGADRALPANAAKLWAKEFATTEATINRRIAAARAAGLIAPGKPKGGHHSKVRRA